MSPSSTSDYSIDHLISKRAAGRTFSHFGEVDLKNAPSHFKANPDKLSLDYGRPNEQYFPVKKLTVELDNYPFQDSLFPEEKEKVSTIVIDKYSSEKGSTGLGEALQYGEIYGHPQFNKFITDFVDLVHKPAYDNWSIIPTNGSGDGLNKAADAILDVGDVVLVEEFTFASFLNTLNGIGAITVPTKLSFSGENADFDVKYLSNLLDNWDELKPELKGKKPKALYTIPTGQNPTGISQSVETRKQIYELASIHDFIIIEDDPYSYLTLPPFAKPDIKNIKQYEITVKDYLENVLKPSYLQFDTQGRVLRLETFSKVFAPGLRLGFIVAHKNVIKAIAGYTSIITRAPSGVSQVLLTSIVEKQYGGLNGYLEWILKMRLAYTHRRNVVIDQLINSKAHDKGYLRIIACDAGMFAAVGINFPSDTDKVKKLTHLNYKFLEYGVGVVLGYKMAVDIDFSRDTSDFLRISFAPLDNDEQLEEAGKRLANAVYDFFENGLEY